MARALVVIGIALLFAQCSTDASIEQQFDPPSDVTVLDAESGFPCEIAVVPSGDRLSGASQDPPVDPARNVVRAASGVYFSATGSPGEVVAWKQMAPSCVELPGEVMDLESSGAV